jgi:hypothetical protein
MFSEYSYEPNNADNLRVAGAITLITSHLFYIPALILCYQYGVFLLTESLLLVVVFSTSYHACLSFESCPVNVPVWMTRKIDHWTSFVLVASALLLMVVAVRCSRQLMKRMATLMDRVVHRRDQLSFLQELAASDREKNITRVVHIVNVFTVFILVFTGNVNSIQVPATVVAVTAMFMFIKILLVGSYYVPTNINANMFALGIFIMLLGCVFFVLPMYLITHTIWHVLPAIGIFFVTLSIVFPEYGPLYYLRPACRLCGACQVEESKLD